MTCSRLESERFIIIVVGGGTEPFLVDFLDPFDIANIFYFAFGFPSVFDMLADCFVECHSIFIAFEITSSRNPR